MFDTIDLWLDRVNMSGVNPFDILPYLTEKTELQNERGYSCIGKCLNYAVFVYERGIRLKGSLAKSFFECGNVGTLTRRATQSAIEKISDCLHTDIRSAKVTRLDVSTIIPTKRTPREYYQFLGTKPHFERFQSTPDTLYYNNHQRQIIFYDKGIEARKRGMAVHESLQDANIFRYELRILNRVNKQLKADVTAQTLYNEVFYQSIVRRWHDEFIDIQKLKNRNFMIDDIATLKVAKETLFTHLLQQSGQGVIDEFVNELKAQKKFNSRSDYTKLKSDLNKMLVAKNGNKNDLMQELEIAVYNVAKYAR